MPLRSRPCDAHDAGISMKLNLGCGFRRKEGFLNVDSQAACNPDLVLDLEKFPWPWENDSVEEIYMSHVLEHLGSTPEIYLALIKEMYRVCKANARLTFIVPHPRSDAFMADPTHVRPITLSGLKMFDQQLNKEWIANRTADTPLGIYLGVDFRVESVDLRIDDYWMQRLRAGEVNQADLEFAIRCYYNVIEELTIVMRAIK